MKKEKLKDALSNYYSSSTVRAILRGTRKPAYETMIKLERYYNIPFNAWLDIKSYLQENDTTNEKTNTNTNNIKKVS